MFRRFETLVDPFAAYPSAAPHKTAWRFIIEQLRPFRMVLGFSLGLTAVGAAIEIWLIYYAGRLVDLLAATSPERVWVEHGGELLTVAAIVLLARPLAGYFRESLDDIAFRPNAETQIRWRTHRHVLGQSVGWFRNDLSGRIVNQVRETGTAATGAAYQVVHTLSFVAIYIVGSLWLVVSIDPRLAMPLAVWVAAYLALMAYVVPRYRRGSEALQGANSQLTGLLVDSYANIETIKLFSNAGEEDRESRSTFDEARQALVRVQRLEVTINASMLLLGSLLIVSLIGYAIILWQSGAAPLGMVAAALALSFRITAMAEWLLDAVSALFGHLGTLRQALNTVSQPLAIEDRPGAAPLTVHAGAIALTNVTHRYGNKDGGLDGLSLTIAGGEKVGLVGRSGAGKSTLVNLVLRFYEPEGGRIEIDGQDIAGVTQESLRARISMVSQDASLLHRSIRDNITYGRSDISDEHMEAAARKAAADTFIPSLRDEAGRTGYDAHVGERGVTLSGGQRQRIALARAILKNAPILVLDEATSALDSEIEAAIQDTLYRVMEGKTVIAIAHRLSTIARMDRIVVLDQGRIAEDGTHADLLAKGGIYAALWARQSGGFIGDVLD